MAELLMVFITSFLSLFLVRISGLGGGPLDAPLRDLGGLVAIATRDTDLFVFEAGRLSATATMRILGAAAFVFCFANLLAAAEPKIGIAKNKSDQAIVYNVIKRKKRA